MNNDRESFNEYEAREFENMARKIRANAASEEDILIFIKEQAEFLKKRKEMFERQKDPDFLKPFGSEEPVSKPKEFEPLQDFGTPEDNSKGFGSM